MNNQTHQLYLVRTIITLLAAPLILIPVGLLLTGGNRSFGYALTLELLPYTYFFMLTWGLFSHIMLVRSYRITLRHYVSAYLACGVLVALVLSEFRFHIEIALGLTMGLLFFMIVPIFAWCLYYKLLSKLKY